MKTLVLFRGPLLSVLFFSLLLAGAPSGVMASDCKKTCDTGKCGDDTTHTGMGGCESSVTTEITIESDGSRTEKVTKHCKTIVAHCKNSQSGFAFA